MCTSVRPLKCVLTAAALFASVGCGQGQNPQDASVGRPTPSEEQVARLIETLRNGSESEKRRAVASVTDIGAPAVPALMEALRDRVPLTRMWAAAALGRLGRAAKDAIPALAKAVKDSDRRVHDSAASALEQIGPEAIPDLARALCDADPDVRAGVAHCFVFRYNPVRASGVKFRHLERQHPPFQVWSDADFDTAASALARALDDPTSNIREASAAALGKFVGSDHAASSLVRTVRDTNAPRSLRCAAARSLGTLARDDGASWKVNGHRVGAECLIAALGDKDQEVRTEAAKSLGAYGSVAVPGLVASLRDGSVEVRRAAALALGRVWSSTLDGEPGQRETRDALRRALHDADQGVRVCAASALADGGVDPEQALPTLFDAFAGSDPYCAQVAGESFKRLKPTAVTHLMAALKDGRPPVREVAAFALGHLGPEAKAAVPALVALLEDKDQLVRNQAARALKSIDPEAAKQAGVK
jgi:HEAT repeat protein